MLKKIFTLFNPRDKEEVTSSSEAVEDNVVDLRINLLNAIVSYFRPFYGKKNFSDTIVIWISNEVPLFQAEVRDKSFEKELRIEFENKQYDVLVDATLIFETKNPPCDADFSEIAKGVFIEFRPLVVEKNEAPRKAKISIVSGMGSLFKYEILIDAAKQKTYNIGRSEVVNDRGIHINHIAIRDNDPSQVENNNCVSRMQAKIVFNDKAGFCLQPLAGGCRPLGGSATKIIRGEQEQELRDINLLLPLYDGDFIELGKAVLLKFEIVDNKSVVSNQASSAFQENDMGI